MAAPTPVRIYAGTQEGLFVWRSKNGSWKNVSIAFQTGTIDAIDGLRSKPNVVFLGVTQDGLYRTDDAGTSWQRVFEGNVRAVTVEQFDIERLLKFSDLYGDRRLTNAQLSRRSRKTPFTRYSNKHLQLMKINLH